MQNYVNGKLVDSAATEFTELVDPATGKVTGRSPKSTPDEVDEAVRAAEAAFVSWRRTTPSHRQQALLKLADAIEDHSDELVELQSRNTGQIKTLITVQPFRDEADALAKANGVPYGLSSSVWTKDHATALRMSRDLDFGCVWINTHIPLAAEMPHGGFGQSGYGKDLSGYGLEDYTRVKHVMSSLD